MGRKLGQHFLHDSSILRRIAEAACPPDCDVVVEVGPGTGALTGYLLERARRVVAIELDAQLAATVRRRFPGAEVVEADVLETDIGRWSPLRVAGNLPYYITSPIIEKVLRLGTRLASAVFLIQEEVADRLIAEPGSRDYGFLSVQTRLLAEPEKLFRVQPGAFRPAPKVYSAVVRLTPRADADPEALTGLIEFAKICFQQKRKTLRNNLRGSYPPEVVDGLPEAASRAEQLSVEQIRELYRRLKSPPLY